MGDVVHTVGGVAYAWVDSWARLPDEPSRRLGWAHHGVAVSREGDVVTFHPGDSRVLVFAADGRLLRSWDAPVLDAHGITLTAEGSVEHLWIADPGAKRDPGIGYQYAPGPRRGQVLKFHMDGVPALTLARPPGDLYRRGTYSPTSVAVFEERLGGTGGVWVADGYGESHVHRYAKDGAYLGSITGTEGSAGRFNCPHAVFIDTRRDDPELYIADRTNRRIQVYDLDGRFKRTFGQEFLTSPSAFVVSGDALIVAELYGRLTVLDRDDRLVGHLGSHPVIAPAADTVPTRLPGWPNRLGPGGGPVRPPDLAPGVFNSPHGVAVDQRGDLYVVEWMIGGRYTKLVRTSP